jgi:hypothetical protein
VLAVVLPSCQRDVILEPEDPSEPLSPEEYQKKVYPYISLTTESEIVGPTRHGKDVDKASFYVRGRMLLNDPDGFYSQTPLVEATLNIRWRGHSTLTCEKKSYRIKLDEKASLLGINADRQTTIREQEFLPYNLRHDFDNAYIVRDGQRVPLVKERRQLVAPGIQIAEKDFPVSPRAIMIFVLIVTLLVTLYEFLKKTKVRWFDALLMLLTGLPGLVLVLMIFSEHPTTSINLQILALNPLALCFIWQVWKGRHTKWFIISAVCLVAFFIGGIWQDYAEGMNFLALSLLCRCLVHYNDK